MDTPNTAVGSPLVDVMGMPLSAIDTPTLLDHIILACSRGEGGWVVTANLDILQVFHSRPEARRAYLDADLRIADGMPLLWAARAQGDRLPERVAGSTLSSMLIARAAERDLGVCLLGGTPGSAERAAERLRQQHTNLKITARSDLRFSDPPSGEQVHQAVEIATEHASKIVLVGLGSPKQEFLIQKMREAMPHAWLIGVGGTFRFLSGEIARAPEFVQRVGLEWAFRLALEPRRLAGRYLGRNLPFLVTVLRESLSRRWSSASGRTERR